MTKSMTGFGKATVEANDIGSFSVEVKSVNNRYLDINVRLPRALGSLEDKIRKAVSKHISRGKVDVSIMYKPNESSCDDVIINMELAQRYASSLRIMQQKLNLVDDISVSLITSFPEVVSVNQKEDDLEQVWNHLSVVVNEAVEANVKMRETEGNKLCENINEKCDEIKALLDTVSSHCEKSIVEYQQRLYNKVAEMINNVKDIDDSRIVEETAIYADKVDVDEEITRFYSHLNQLKDTLKLEEPIGRKMDFIIQEMNREANTIASKSISIEITNIVINIKNIIEKIREQVQNIE